MRQSEQDDHFDDLATFAECVYFNLVLSATKRTLTENEVYLLDRAAEVAEKLHRARLSL